MSAPEPGLLARWRGAPGAGASVPAVFAPAGTLSRGALLRRARGAASRLAPGERCRVAGTDVRIWLPWLIGCALRGAVWECHPLGRRAPPPPRAHAPAPAADTEPCLAIRTTGTTGAARILLRDRAGWLRCFAAEAELLSLTAADRVLVLGSPAFSLVPYAALRAVHLGAVLGVLPRIDAGGARHLLAALRPTIVYGAPPLAMALARLGAGIRGYPGPQRVITGGTRLTAAQLAALRGAWPGVRVTSFYGSAETSFLAMRPEVDAADLDDSGPPFPGVEAAVDGDGRLRVRTPYAAVAEVIPDGGLRPLAGADGWITVEDRVAIGGDGHLRVLARADRCIDLGGTLVDPEPAERRLEALPWVAEAALVAVPDARRTARAVAAVITAGPPPGDAAAALRRSLGAACPVPVRIERLTGTPPRTAGGKLDRRALAAALANGALPREPLP